MAIVRGPRPTTSFTVLRNDVLRDSRLSYRARGLLAAILSRPDNWRCSSTQLATEGREGRDAVRTALAELEAVGYLTRHTYRRADGRLMTDSVVSDTPPPKPEKPHVGLPVAGMPGNLSKNVNNKLKKGMASNLRRGEQ